MSESERPPVDPLREAAKEAADYLRAIGSVTLADQIDAALASPAAPSAEPYYLPMDCPVCGRHRMMWNGEVLSCEKCSTSSEWDGFSSDRYAASPAAPRPEGLDVDRLREAIDALDDEAETNRIWRAMSSQRLAEVILARLSDTGDTES